MIYFQFLKSQDSSVSCCHWTLVQLHSGSFVDLNDSFLLCARLQICATTIDLGAIQKCGMQMAKEAVKPLQQISKAQQSCEASSPGGSMKGCFSKCGPVSLHFLFSFKILTVHSDIFLFIAYLCQLPWYELTVPAVV